MNLAEFIDHLVADAEMEVRSTRDDLLRDMNALSAHLQRAAARLQTDIGGFNSLGEVQQSGRDIDRMCSQLREKLDHRRRILKLREKMIEERRLRSMAESATDED